MSINKKTSIIVCLSILVALVICVTLCILTIKYFNDNIAFVSEEEIIKVFQDNKNSFVTAADDLFEYQFDWTIRKNKVIHKYDEDDFPERIFLYLNNNAIQLTVNNKALLNESIEMKNELETKESVENILVELKFKSIYMNCFSDLGCIYFVKQSAIGHADGIIYCPNGKPANEYITKFVELEPSWYYYEED